MLNTTEQRSKTVTDLLNGTISSVKNVIPINHNTEAPHLLESSLKLTFGVLIGITGDIKGKLVLAGESTVFGTIGEKMFGMPLEGEMLSSFSGELGNMIAGGLSTNMNVDGTRMDITAPTMLQGDTTLTGYEKAVKLPIVLEDTGTIFIYMLLD
ncbi:chemotaxis protein CheX [Aquibacillus sediminis]|uniref:chemotaxis protein CheX n=1 Tax=Aquibacillus sediminis TaxID=2574734 RepID=UPI001107EC7B|nr:chemotaxis protein CheX [Aquibacillus sediminis]